MSGRQCVTGERNIGVSLLLLLLIVSAGCRQSVRDAARRGDLKQIKTLSAIGAHIIPIVINYCAQHRELGKQILSFQDREQLSAKHLLLHNANHHNQHKHD